MSFRGVCLTPGAAVNRRFWACLVFGLALKILLGAIELLRECLFDWPRVTFTLRLCNLTSEQCRIPCLESDCITAMSILPVGLALLPPMAGDVRVHGSCPSTRRISMHGRRYPSERFPARRAHPVRDRIGQRPAHRCANRRHRNPPRGNGSCHPPAADWVDVGAAPKQPAK
jgi:hypothetical protein